MRRESGMPPGAKADDSWIRNPRCMPARDDGMSISESRVREIVQEELHRPARHLVIKVKKGPISPVDDVWDREGRTGQEGGDTGPDQEPVHLIAATIRDQVVDVTQDGVPTGGELDRLGYLLGVLKGKWNLLSRVAKRVRELFITHPKTVDGKEWS